MNTTVNFELAKLLKERGYSKRTPMVWLFSLGKTHLRELHLSLELNDAEYNAPTIAEVVMWLYKNHKIWINVKQNSFLGGGKSSFISNVKKIEYNSPTEAYEAAIFHVLDNLI